MLEHIYTRNIPHKFQSIIRIFIESTNDDVECVTCYFVQSSASFVYK